MQGRVFLNRYETIRLLGEGGMGRVYLARQTDLGRQVVVKVMHDHIAADPAFRMRFQRETLLTARFQHPYAVSDFDASLDDPEGPCIVMEYIRGESLDTILTRNIQAFVSGKDRVERLATDVLHDDARPLGVVECGVEDRDGIRMLESSRQQRLALEPHPKCGISGNMVVHDLDHDLPSEVGLSGQIDPTHAALAEQSDRLVSI